MYDVNWSEFAAAVRASLQRVERPSLTQILEGACAREGVRTPIHRWHRQQRAAERSRRNSTGPRRRRKHGGRR